jgi:hypothetical protein
MKKTVKDNIIFVDKPKMSLVPLVLSAASLLFVVLGAASLFYLQKPLQDAQDIRNQASIDGGQVELTSELVSSSTFTSGAPSVIDLKYNSNGVQLTGIQIVVKVQANTETPLIEVPATSNLQAIYQEVEQVSDGYLVSVIVASKTLGGAFSSSTATTFAKVTVPLLTPGQIVLSYDRPNSIATVANSTPPRDELRTPVDATFTIGSAVSPSPVVSASASPTPIAAAVSPTPSASPVGSASPSPSASVIAQNMASPSPTPAASANPSPTPNNNQGPTPVPTPQPSPTPAQNNNNNSIPSGDDFRPRSDRVTVTFLSNDSARRVIPLSDMRPYQSYRARVDYLVQNNNKSSTNNSSPVNTAFVINGQGNSYTTQSLGYNTIANNSDGGSGTIETVFSTQPNNTLRITVDAPNNYNETDEGNNIVLYNFDVNAATGGPNRTCDQYCADSRECAAGYTCFYNRCRRPDNPDSSSCSAPSVTVAAAITKACNGSCSSNRECAINLRCYQGACRLATNPSSFTCSAATANVITGGSQGTKGEEIPSPTPVVAAPVQTTTPTAVPSVRPTASPSVKPAVSPTAVPVVSAVPTATPMINNRATDTNADETLFATILGQLQARGISVPVIAVSLGLLLFILALLFAILGRLGRRKASAPGTVPSAPRTAYEDDLQKKINALKARDGAPSTSPSGAPLPPKNPVTPPAASQPAAGSMMGKLKDRGVLENMPKS